MTAAGAGRCGRGLGVTVDCDTGYRAIGQRIDRSWAETSQPLAWSPRQLIAADAGTLQTSLRACSRWRCGQRTGHRHRGCGRRPSGGGEHTTAFSRGFRWRRRRRIAESRPKEDRANWLDIPPDTAGARGSMEASWNRKDGAVLVCRVALGLEEEQARAEAPLPQLRGLLASAWNAWPPASQGREPRHDRDHRNRRGGAVIVATGFKTFDPPRWLNTANGIFPEVYTASS